ncbi:MAG: hypothetical protein LUH51_08585 [Firmicutes bacterium]|nr:hypothetical protein [Bacillota bacterium]
MKKIISWILIVCMMLPFCLTANAANTSADGSEPSVADRIESMVSAAYSDIPGEYTVGSAAAIYNADSESVYYVAPIFRESECVGTVQVDSGGHVTLTDETTLYTNMAGLSADYLLYTSGGIVYAQTSGEIIALYDTGFDVGADEAFEALSYADKLAAASQCADASSGLDVAAAIAQTGQIVIDDPGVSVCSVVPAIEAQTCAITNFVSQSNQYLCWAACVATIVNYKTSYSGITDKAVAKAIDYGYTAARTDDILNAFDYYGLSYSATGSKIGWSAVKSNINKDCPFAVIVHKNYGNGHMLVAYGYSCAYGDSELYADERCVELWNPYSSTKIVIAYHDETYTIDGYSCSWDNTLVD